jgi:hypothetical protein
MPEQAHVLAAVRISLGAYDDPYALKMSSNPLIRSLKL